MNAEAVVRKNVISMSLKRNKFIFGLAGLLCVGGLAGLLYFEKIQSAEAVNEKLREQEELEEEKMDVPNCNITQEMANEQRAKTIANRSTIDNIGNGATTVKRNILKPIEKKELQDRIKAMSPKELEAVIEVIPVELCMKRIQDELDHAREFESMIKKAYEMK